MRYPLESRYTMSSTMDSKRENLSLKIMLSKGMGMKSI